MRVLYATHADPNTRKYNLNIIIRYADRYAIKFIKVRLSKHHKSIQRRCVKKNLSKKNVRAFLKQKVYNVVCRTRFKLYIPLTLIFYLNNRIVKIGFIFAMTDNGAIIERYNIND